MCAKPQDHMEDGGDDEGVHHMANDAGDPAAKRQKQQCPRYNEQQLRKLEAFYPIRDRVDPEQVAAAVNVLDGGRVVSRENVQQWFANKLKSLGNAGNAEMHANVHPHPAQSWSGMSGLVDAAHLAASNHAPVGAGPVHADRQQMTSSAHVVGLHVDPRFGGAPGPGGSFRSVSSVNLGPNLY